MKRGIKSSLKFAIFDIDNCISDDGWRVPLILPRDEHPDVRFHEYHLNMEHDKPGNLEVLHNHINEGHLILFFTAAPERYRRQRGLWLSRHAPCKHILFMRQSDDHSHSVELKIRMLQNLNSVYMVEHSDIAQAYDDREEVVSAYQKAGVPASVLKIHNIEYNI